MGRLTNEQKAKIVRLRERNTNISQIVKILAEDDCHISRLSVRRFLRRFQETQSFANAPKSGRPNENVTTEITNFIDSEMERDDELTASKLRLLREQTQEAEKEARVGADGHKVLPAYSRGKLR